MREDLRKDLRQLIGLHQCLDVIEEHRRGLLDRLLRVDTQQNVSPALSLELLRNLRRKHDHVHNLPWARRALRLLLLRGLHNRRAHAGRRLRRRLRQAMHLTLVDHVRGLLLRLFGFHVGPDGFHDSASGLLKERHPRALVALARCHRLDELSHHCHLLHIAVGQHFVCLGLRIGAPAVHELQDHGRDDGRQGFEQIHVRVVRLRGRERDESLHRLRLRLLPARYHRSEDRRERRDERDVVRNGIALRGRSRELRGLCGSLALLGHLFDLRRELLLHQVELELVLTVFALALDAVETLRELGLRFLVDRALGFELLGSRRSFGSRSGDFSLHVCDLLQCHRIAGDARTGRKLCLVMAQVVCLLLRGEPASPAENSRLSLRLLTGVHERLPRHASERKRALRTLRREQPLKHRRLPVLHLKRIRRHTQTSKRSGVHALGLLHLTGEYLRVGGARCAFDPHHERREHALQQVHRVERVDQILAAASHLPQATVEVGEVCRGDRPLTHESLKLAPVVAARHLDADLVDPLLDGILDPVERNLLLGDRSRRACTRADSSFSHLLSPPLAGHSAVLLGATAPLPMRDSLPAA